MNIQEAFNNLSSEEIDLLNSDPQMLQAFKTKYSGPAPEPSMASKVADKLKSISPELVNPVNAIPGVAAAKLGMAALKKSQEGYDLMGNMANEALGARGHTTLGPAVGTTISMTPDLAGAAATLSPIAGGVAGEVAQSGITAPLKSLGTDVGDIASSIGQGIKTLGKRITTGPTTEQVANLRNQLGGLSGEKASKLAQLEEMRQQAGTGIESARTAAGIPQQLSGLPEFGTPAEAADFFKNKIGSMKPEELAQAYGKDGLAQLRDSAQALKEKGITSTQNAFINRGVANIDKALAKVAPGVSEAYQQYGTVQQAAEMTPQDFINKAAALRSQIRMLQPKASMEQNLRRGLSLGAGASGPLLFALKRLGLLGGQ